MFLIGLTGSFGNEYNYIENATNHHHTNLENSPVKILKRDKRFILFNGAGVSKVCMYFRFIIVIMKKHTDFHQERKLEFWIYILGTHYCVSRVF